MSSDQPHLELSDSTFAKEFEDLSLDPSLFTHQAHLRLAWIHIREHGIEQAIENVCSQIQNFALHQGDKDKYHVTVTVAAVRAVYHFLLKSKADDFQSFIQEFPRLETNFRDLIDAHYGTDIFSSALARMTYQEPDLRPFD